MIKGILFIMVIIIGIVALIIAFFIFLDAVPQIRAFFSKNITEVSIGELFLLFFLGLLFSNVLTSKK